MQVDAETTLAIVDRGRHIRDFLTAHGFKATHLRPAEPEVPAMQEAGGGDGKDLGAMAPLFRLLSGIGEVQNQEGDPAATRLTALAERLPGLVGDGQ